MRTHTRQTEIVVDDLTDFTPPEFNFFKVTLQARLFQLQLFSFCSSTLSLVVGSFQIMGCLRHLFSVTFVCSCVSTQFSQILLEIILDTVMPTDYESNTLNC